MGVDSPIILVRARTLLLSEDRGMKWNADSMRNWLVTGREPASTEELVPPPVQEFRVDRVTRRGAVVCIWSTAWWPEVDDGSAKTGNFQSRAVAHHGFCSPNCRG